MGHVPITGGPESLCERVLRALGLKDFVTVSISRLPRIPMTPGRIMIPLSAEITLVGERTGEKCPQQWRRDEAALGILDESDVSATRRERGRPGMGSGARRGA